jgi:hypothetical protein
MSFDPAALELDKLFVDPDMFDSRKAWRRAGFDVLDPQKDTECMVAGHASAPGYLFKKYPDRISQAVQRDNFAARARGAARVAELIRALSLEHAVVPQKHVHELPRSFGKDVQVLVVERLDIVGTDASEERYANIAEPVLRDLLRVLVKFPGLDSNSKNVQFTRGGKIAFIDLENYRRRDRTEVTLRSIRDYLSREKFKLARTILGARFKEAPR